MGLLQMLRAGLCWTPADHIISVTPVLDATKGLPAKREGVRTDGLECRKAGHFRGAGPGPVKPGLATCVPAGFPLPTCTSWAPSSSPESISLGDDTKWF